MVSITSFIFNLQALHSLKYQKRLRTLDEPVEISRLSDFSDLSSRMFFAAFFCFILGLVFAHLAFMGGGFFLLFKAFHYLEKLNDLTKPS